MLEIQIKPGHEVSFIRLPGYDDIIVLRRSCMSIDANKGFLFPLLLSIFLVPAYGQTANPDEDTIDEDTQASVDVTKNDFSFFGIDKKTVDLRPNEDGIQHTYTTDAGTFSSSDKGVVTFIPVADFSGNATASYTFKNNFGQTSGSANITITVRAVNDVPEITGQNSVVMQEGGSRELLVTDLIIADPDDSYPSGFTLIVQSGENYTVSGTTVTPAPDFSGVLTVEVRVDDGDDRSRPFDLKVTVDPVNGVPEITGQADIAMNEDQSRAIQFSDLEVSDADDTYPNGFQLTVLDGVDYTFAGNVITPAENFNGLLTVNVKVNDGTDDSNVFGLKITVNPVNDVPVITGQSPLSVGEGQPLTLATSQLQVSDPDNSYPADFTLSVLSGSNYSVSGHVVTPAANFNGTLQVRVFVNDGTANSAIYNLEITVNATNDVPVITGQVPLQVNEDVSIALKLADLTVSDSDDPYPTGFTLKVSAGSNYTVSGAVVTPNADFSGTLTVPVRVNDGSNDSAPFNLQVKVAPVNDAPTLDAVAVAAIKEDAALQTVTLKGITAGPRETQDLAVTVATNKPELFETLAVVYTSPQATGTLRINPKANANGTAQISITVQDSGPGTPAPNVNFVKRSFSLTIQAVNDVPVFKSEPVLAASASARYEYNIVVTDADGEALTLTAPTKPSWLTFAVQINGKAKLSGTPPANASGAAAVKISAKDAATAVVQSFTITINGQPVVRPVAVQTPEDKMFSFTRQLFADAFTDGDGDGLAEIKITALPRHGTLKLNGASIQDAVTVVIAASDIGGLTYTPATEYSGHDTLRWNGSDGKSYAKAATYASIMVANANDPPMIADLETDTLAYEVGNETPRLFTATFRAEDADDDSLASAEVGFRRQNHSASSDRLIFTNTRNIKGTFDSQAGILSLSGKAPLAEYTEAIRSIAYNYVNMTDMMLDIKNIYITLNDGKAFGETRNRQLALIYTFKDLDIPTGFTPNGDNANDYWKITSVKGTDQYNDAEIRVFDRRGQLLYQAVGFGNPWDGTFRGERLPVDTYYYTIDLKYNKIRYKGVVTLLR